jgi:hypothetical protein
VRRDAREDTFHAVRSEQRQEPCRSGNDDLLHPFVEWRPRVIAALIFPAQRSSVGPVEINVLNIDDEKGRFTPVQHHVVRLGGAVIINRAKVCFPIH